MEPSGTISRKITKILCAVSVAVVCLAAVVLWEPVRIAYHTREFHRLRKLSTEITADGKQTSVIQSSRWHRSQLESLGVIEAKTIRFEHIKLPSTAATKLVDELRRRHQPCFYWESSSYQSGKPMELDLWGSKKEVQDFQQAVETIEADLWDRFKEKPEMFDDAFKP